ncbi:ionotropic receptor 25a-like [Penaeus japonicus]|uniref:ionotropic receptor 25a-like n=1 Tax=Penaeus japonicus TaxID=27405 RepID=UPI001C70B420|nr:ionotropic receptor 25a-like [Penaeus japonicus]
MKQIVLLANDASSASAGLVLDALWHRNIQVSLIQTPSLPGDSFPSGSPPEVTSASTFDPGYGQLESGFNENITEFSEGSHQASESKRVRDVPAGNIPKDLLNQVLGKGDGHVGVLVLGDADWVTRMAIQINKDMLLGPGNILLIHPMSGSVVDHSITSQLRLAAKVVVLEWSRWNIKGCEGIVRQGELAPRGRYTLRSVGCWDKSGRGLRLRKPLLPALSDLRGAEVKVVIVKDFIEAIRVGPRRSYLVGFLGHVVNTLAASANFRYVIMEGSGFGNAVANGSYDGVVGHIERKEGDLGLASLSITYHRLLAIDYTTWLMFDPMIFLTRSPSIIIDPLSLFKLYTWQSWVVITAFLVSSSLWLWMFWLSTPYDTPLCPWFLRRSNKKEGNIFTGYATVFSIVLRTAVYQASRQPPSSSPGRVVYVCIWAVVIILFAVYSGNLTAFLSKPRVTKPPATIRELVFRDWTISLDKAYGAHDIVKATKTEDYQILYRRANERGAIRENQGAQGESRTDVTELESQDIAIVMGATGAYYMMNKNKAGDNHCRLTYGTEAIAKKYSALALPKMSLLKPIFDRKLMWMRQMGIVRKLYDNSFGVKCFREVLNSSELKPMALGQLTGVLYVWLGGMGLASLVFVCEIYVHRR